MKLSHNLFNLILLALIVAAVAGLILTARPPRSQKPSPGQQGSAASGAYLIDQRPLRTARNLSLLASTPEEKQLAKDAERISDHEVDLAFTEALRAASEEPPAKKNPVIQARVNRAQSLISVLKARIKRLTGESSKAPADRKSGLQGQIALAQAQLDLAQNELADAQQDMAREGGDAYSHIERLWAEHQAEEHSNGTTRLSGTSGGTHLNQPSRSLISRWTFWAGQASKRSQISEAQHAVNSKLALLTRRHDALQTQIEAAQVHKQTSPQQPPGQAKAGTGEVEQQTLTRLHRLSQSEAQLAGLDRRIQDLRGLSNTYTEWSGLVIARQRDGFHLLMRSALWILLALLLASLACHLINQFFDRLKLERKQRMTLRGLVRFVVQVGALLIILIVIFGSPSHMSTILGLVGAGLAVALKSFVVAFFGWFVLMGRNGIQVGDWVEINGVRGEVLEIGLLRTILLETGNWTEAGHPTGRQVAFLNSYAVEGYYFNFSTSGQWMWDQLTITIQSGTNPYQAIEKVRTAVSKETEADVRNADEEWRRVARRCGVRSFSAEPEINVRPTDAGVQLIVRYITRVNKRYEVRNRLSHVIVKLLQPTASIEIAPSTLPSASAQSSPEDGDGAGGHHEDEIPESSVTAPKARG